MSAKDKIGDRMKENYENRAKTYLTRRTPVIIRIDGKAFHSFTKNFQRPFDPVFHEAMNSTLEYLCKNIQGCKLGYTQSDEISLLLTDYDMLTTDAWFDYNVQKMCSVAASMATLAFNRSFASAAMNWWDSHSIECPEDANLFKAYHKAIQEGAMFDARCFNIPESEVCNAFIWRQQDAIRNSIQMLGQSQFSSQKLHGKNCDEIKEMVLEKAGISFDCLSIEFKRGVCCFKNKESSRWILDMESPLFQENRNYIERFVYIDNKVE